MLFIFTLLNTFPLLMDVIGKFYRLLQCAFICL